MSTIKISDETFEENVIKNNKPIIIDFWAEWCGPCKQIGPILEEISDEYNDKIIIGKMDVDENPETPGKYQIRGIPTMLLFNKGELIDTKVGMSSKTDLKEWIDKNI
jgi:thioredoxin 1